MNVAQIFEWGNMHTSGNRLSSFRSRDVFLACFLLVIVFVLISHGYFLMTRSLVIICSHEMYASDQRFFWRTCWLNSPYIQVQISGLGPTVGFDSNQGPEALGSDWRTGGAKQGVLSAMSHWGPQTFNSVPAVMFWGCIFQMLFLNDGLVWIILVLFSLQDWKICLLDSCFLWEELPA